MKPIDLCKLLVFLLLAAGTSESRADSTLASDTKALVPVVVTREFVSPGRINPFQSGQFVEYLCNLVPSMWADKLDDGSFEGLSPYKMAYIRDTDFREHPWYPSGATNRAKHDRDRATKVSGEASLKIAAGEEISCMVAVSQDGLALKRGVACDFSCYFKQVGLKGPVRVRMHREGAVYASCEFNPSGDWLKYHAKLMPSGTDTSATLTIEFPGPATVWLDNASLMPADSVGGWRKDVVDAVRAQRPGIIRFGGSTLDDASLGEFEWRDTIGDPDRRRPFRAWGGLQPTGPGLAEFIDFCRLVGAEPLICVRFRRRSPESAAEQVQYFNGGVDTPMGSFRARNGHPQPYRVRYWQVGNEQAGGDYEERLAAFCQAMKQADPTVLLLSSYPSPGVLKRAGAFIDFVSPHHYDCVNLAGVESDLASIGRMLNDHAPGRPIKVAVTEWNTTGGDWGLRRARLWTLENALACSRYHNLIHRHGDQVAIACRSNLINSFCSGFLQSDNHRLYKTPTYYAQTLYSTLAGDRPLKIGTAAPGKDGPDISATLTPQGDAVVLFAVNDQLTPIERALDFSAFQTNALGNGQEIDVWTLADTKRAGEPDVTNSFAEPERVATRRSTYRAASCQFDYRFPPLSLTVLRWVIPAGERKGESTK
jgi:alpha-L-arabinofuranosidase